MITSPRRHSSAWALLATLSLGVVARAAETEAQEPAMSLPRTRRHIAEKKPVRVVFYGDSIGEVKKGRNRRWRRSFQLRV